MSIRIMSAVFDSTLEPNEKLVALAYADHANDDGNAIYPSIARLAYKTSYDERTVQRITRKLEEARILLPMGKSQYETNLYRFNAAALPKGGGGKLPPPRQNATPGVAFDTQNDAQMSPESSFKSSVKPENIEEIDTYSLPEPLLRLYNHMKDVTDKRLFRKHFEVLKLSMDDGVVIVDAPSQFESLYFIQNFMAISRRALVGILNTASPRFIVRDDAVRHSDV